MYENLRFILKKLIIEDIYFILTLIKLPIEAKQSYNFIYIKSR